MCLLTHGGYIEPLTYVVLTLYAAIRKRVHDTFQNRAIYFTPPGTIGCGFTRLTNGIGSI